MKSAQKLIVLGISLGVLGWAQSTLQGVNSIVWNTPQKVSATPPSISVIGQSGNTSYYYWVVANFGSGKASPSSPTLVSNAPLGLNSNNYLNISWNGVTGAISYDLLRTTTPNLPTTPSAIAVVLGTTSLNFKDQGLPLQNYSLTTQVNNGCVWSMNSSTGMINTPCLTNIVSGSSLPSGTGLVAVANGNSSTVPNTLAADPNLASVVSLLQNSAQVPLQILITGDSISECWGNTFKGGTCNNLGPLYKSDTWVEQIRTAIGYQYLNKGSGLVPLATTIVEGGTTLDTPDYTVTGTTSWSTGLGPVVYGNGMLLQMSPGSAVTSQTYPARYLNVYYASN